MKRPMIWASVGMFAGLLFLQISFFYRCCVFLCGLIIFLILLYKHRFLSIVFLCGCFLGLFTFFCYHTKYSQITDDLSETTYLEGTVKETYDYGFRLRVTAYGNDSVTHILRNLYSYYVLVYSDTIPDSGTKTIIVGQPEMIQHADNPGQFDAFDYYSSIGCIRLIQTDEIYIKHPPVFINRWISLLRNGIRNRIRKLFPEETAGICLALLLGDKSLMGEEQKDLYERFGLAHILTVSGLHIGIFSRLVFAFLLLFLSRKNSERTVTVIVLLYGMLCMYSVSCIRAIFIMILSFGARRFKRTYDSLSANLFLMICILFIAPYRLFNLSFQLSFLAGILLAISASNIAGNGKGIFSLFRSSLILQTGLLPIQLSAFYTFAPIGIVLNIVLLAFLEGAFILLMIALIFSVFSLFLGSFFAGSVHYIFYAFQKLLSLLGTKRFFTLTLGKPKMIVVFLFAMIFAFVLYMEREFNRKYIMILCALWLLFVPIRKHPIVANLSVGQGDCSVILYRSTAIVIDCGSLSKLSVGEKILSPFLQYYGYDHADYVFISHFDEDHINGFRENNGVLTDKTVIYTDEYFRNNTTLDDLCNSDHFCYTKQGDSLSLGDIQIDFIGTKVDYGNDANEYCQLMNITLKGYHFLFLGDVSGNILDKLEMNDYIYLVKVPHHGSKNSLSEEFYEKIHPLVSVISVGRNSYGHPHQEILNILNKYSDFLYVTKDSGAVITEIGNSRIHTTSYKGNR